MPTKKKVEETPTEEVEVVATETAVTEAPTEEVAETTPAVEEEVLETKNGFTFFRRGDEYAVLQGSIAIAPYTTDRGAAEQLFRGMTRKF